MRCRPAGDNWSIGVQLTVVYEGGMVGSFWQAVGFGVVTAAIVGLSAVALNLQFGVTNFPNFAHGEFLTVGAYAAFAMQHFNTNLAVDALAGSASGAVLGYVMNRFAFQPFVRKGKRVILLLVVSAAVSQIIEDVIPIIFGQNNVVFQTPTQVARHYGPFLWTTLDIQVIVASAISVALLHAVLHYTSFGRAQRAAADDTTLARITGINTSRVISATWLITGALAGLAGVALAATVGSFNSLLGFNFLLVTFAAGIIGGIGSSVGAILGAIVIGLITEITGFYLSSGYKQEFALLALAAFLFIRPQGILAPLQAAE